MIPHTENFWVIYIDTALIQKRFCFNLQFLEYDNWPA